MAKRPRMWWTTIKGGRRAAKRPFKWSRDDGPDVPKRVRRAASNPEEGEG